MGWETITWHLMNLLLPDGDKFMSRKYRNEKNTKGGKS